MGTEESEIKRAVNGEIYTPEEISKLKEAREKIENPKSDTIMQKVVAVDTGEIEKDLKAHAIVKYMVLYQRQRIQHRIRLLLNSAMKH